jgi:hypothetical protein
MTRVAGDRSSAAGSGARPFGLRGPLGGRRALDLWVTCYALGTLPLLAYGWIQGRPGCARQVLMSLLVLGLQRGVIAWSRDTDRAAPHLLRLFFAPMVYLVFYHQVEHLWPLFREAPLDPLLVRAEAALFGCQPSLAFRAALPWRGLSELFCAAYYLYYFFTPVVGLTALLRQGYASAERYLLTATGTFLACYAFFWVLPTVGPHHFLPPGGGPRPYDGYVFNRLLFLLTGPGEIRGGAFPSSHIAVAVASTLWARREARPLFPALAVLTVLMLPAVVYLRAHYLLDVPAGFAAGVLGAWAGNRLTRGGGVRSAPPP